MTLFDLLKGNQGEEFTITDKDYDCEFYMEYCDESKCDDWDSSMMRLARKLKIEGFKNNHVEVNLYELLENNADTLCDVLGYEDIDDIADNIDSIMAGFVSEKWLDMFVECLSVL